MAQVNPHGWIHMGKKLGHSLQAPRPSGSPTDVDTHNVPRVDSALVPTPWGLELLSPGAACWLSWEALKACRD